VVVVLVDAEVDAECVMREAALKKRSTSPPVVLRVWCGHLLQDRSAVPTEVALKIFFLLAVVLEVTVVNDACCLTFNTSNGVRRRLVRIVPEMPAIALWMCVGGGGRRDGSM
jgi:hypothetical protein